MRRKQILTIGDQGEKTCAVQSQLCVSFPSTLLGPYEKANKKQKEIMSCKTRLNFSYLFDNTKSTTIRKPCSDEHPQSVSVRRRGISAELAVRTSQLHSYEICNTTAETKPYLYFRAVGGILGHVSSSSFHVYWLAGFCYCLCYIFILGSRNRCYLVGHGGSVSLLAFASSALGRVPEQVLSRNRM